MTDHDRPAFETLVREAVRRSARARFADGFADRALARWSAEPRPEERGSGGRMSSDARGVLPLVERVAKRVVPLAIAASLVLALYSASDATAGARSPLVNRLFGWYDTSTSTPAVASIYDVYGLTSSPVVTNP